MLHATRKDPGQESFFQALLVRGKGTSIVSLQCALNPAAGPQVGKMIELLGSKAAVSCGRFHYGTAFGEPSNLADKVGLAVSCRTPPRTAPPGRSLCPRFARTPRAHAHARPPMVRLAASTHPAHPAHPALPRFSNHLSNPALHARRSRTSAPRWCATASATAARTS